MPSQLRYLVKSAPSSSIQLGRNLTSKQLISARRGIRRHYIRLWTRFQNEDSILPGLGQPVGEHKAGRPTSTNNEVVLIINAVTFDPWDGLCNGCLGQRKQQDTLHQL
jgi:hypothetical protein